VVRPLFKATLAGEVRKNREGALPAGRIEVRGGEYIASSAGDQNTGSSDDVLADAIAVLPADKTVFSRGRTRGRLPARETLR